MTSGQNPNREPYCLPPRTETNEDYSNANVAFALQHTGRNSGHEIVGILTK